MRNILDIVKTLINTDAKLWSLNTLSLASDDKLCLTSFVIVKYHAYIYHWKRYEILFYLPVISGDQVVSISSVLCSLLCEFLQTVVFFARNTTSRVAKNTILIRMKAASNGTPNECVVLSERWDCVVFLNWFKVLFSSFSVVFVIRGTGLFAAWVRKSSVLFCRGYVVSLSSPGITFILSAWF